ncbi:MULTISPECIES: DUF6036 family nucleotidyltransferase [unclassified Variovorax]|jgi:hypothetical protein|uniref:DUF6036 family nucleotidyltransferase n=1 Tax=unclassified Variovorax TaxID=663243 RepID=UPI0019B1C58C|nr:MULTISPECIES: DUF6036 family nucleotidyltransferase [unclassified Variovorax]MBC7395051.1 hypothetical protein [Variovorax sp.]MEB0056444.1 hypothetical protein [Variovorax sp. LG9.2]MEB0110507.1 hypothetical protein [Variovorax sp. RTB1]
MKLEELQHVLRAAAAITQENSLVVVGSQAILLLLDEPPAALLISREVDLYPAMHPERADLIDGAIGMHSSFHETFGYFADGVGPETAVMPADWMKRASLHYIGEVTATCPDLHDLALSKCVAGREKDADFVRELPRSDLLSAVILKERLSLLDSAKYPLEHIGVWINRRHSEAKANP